MCDDMKNKIASKRNINYIILHHFFYKGGLRYPFQDLHKKWLLIAESIRRFRRLAQIMA